jgi:hypothetical protein
VTRIAILALPGRPSARDAAPAKGREKMAVRYFCDRCGKETGEGELRAAELSIPPDPDISLDLCPECARQMRSTIVGKDDSGTAQS